MKSKTENGVRYFTCKRCGKQIEMPVEEWKKRKQSVKNICKECTEKERLARIERKEETLMNRHPYGVVLRQR